MNIRKGRLSDFRYLLKTLNATPEIGGSATEKTYSKEFVLGTLKSKNQNLVLIAEDKKKIVGFIIAEIWKDKKYSFLITIFVDKNYRGNGVSSLLEKEYIKYCKKLKLKSIVCLVLTNNKRMQKWCKKKRLKRGNKLYYYWKKI